MARTTPKPDKSYGYDDTPVIPGTQWHVHDGMRPQPTVVDPGSFSSQDQPGTPPSDAVMLFDGSSLDGWVSAKDPSNPAGWQVENGYMQVVPKTGDIQTQSDLGDCQLHLEFASPAEVKGQSQGRGNSGVFLMGRYEIQVLDNYENPTYPDGTVGGIYGQFPPLYNPIREPGAWNFYDIIWEGPRFDGDKLTRPAFVTVLLNGIIQHNRKELLGPTDHKKLTEYTPHPPAAPLKLQDHGDLVRFRNIWYRPLRQYDE